MASPVFNWVPKRAKEENNSKVMKGIWVACDPPQNASSAAEITESTPLTNHWVLFLVTGNNSAIRVSPAPNPSANMVLDLQIQEQDSQVIESAHKKIWLDLLGSSHKVGDIFADIERANYHRYQFSENGIGCRFWVYSTIRKLEELGYFSDREQCNESLDAIGLVWRDGEKVEPQQQTGFENNSGSRFL